MFETNKALDFMLLKKYVLYVKTLWNCLEEIINTCGREIPIDAKHCFEVIKIK